MNKILIVAIVLFFVAGNTQAQDYRFKKVDNIDFERLTPENEEEPDAEILYRNEEVSFSYVQDKGFIQTRSVQERIKINNDNGLEYATKKIRLYNETTLRRERLKNLRGYTYTKINDKIEEDKLRNSGEFEEEIDEYWKLSSFTMPNVRVGSVIEYEYDIESPFLAIDDVELQFEIPIRKIDVQIEMIEYFTYNLFFNPRASFVPNLERLVASDKVTTTSKSRSGGFNNEPVKTNFSSQQYEISNQILKINTENIPALKSEPMSGNISNYRSKIVFELSVVRYPNRPVEFLSVDWKAVTKSIYENEKFGKELGKSSFYEDELATALDGVVSNKEKIITIFDFVRQKVKWNGYYGILCSEGIKDTFKNGSGNVADVNLLLTSMLQSQNIEAYPLLISTKNNGIPLFPTRNGFNYVAVVVKDGERFLKLDATDRNVPIGQLPLHASNWEGRVIEENGDSYSIPLEPEDFSKEQTLYTLALTNDLKLEGTGFKRLSEYMALNYRENYINSTDNEIANYLKSDDSGLDISDIETKNVKNLDQPIDLSYHISYNNYAEQIGDKIYISPLLNESNSENPFKLSERKLPIVFSYPISTKCIVNIDIPKGFEVESMPESSQINYNDNVGFYKYIISNSNNRISVMAEFNLTALEILPSNYQTWKDFFTAVVAKDAEKIVLKKI